MPKRSVVIAFLSIVWLGLSLYAANQRDWDAAGEAWWKNVEYLASDDLGGRNVGSAGYEKAAAYVAGQFEKAGLQPGAGTSYFQPVGFTETSLDAARSSLQLVRNGKVSAVAVPGEAQLGYARSSAKKLEAPLVFAGYGLVVPEARHNDLEGLNVKGAVVVFMTGGPEKIDGNLRSHYSSGAERWKALRSAGAIGTISIPNPASMEIPWARQILSWGMPRMTPADPALANSEGQQFGASWDPSRAEDLFAGSGHTFTEVVEAAKAERSLPRFALATRVRAAVATSTRSIKSKNVAGFVPGSDPTLKNEIVVMSAHLDHLGVGKPVEGDSIYNGAMDDASGVASLIEIAKSLHASGTKAKRSLLFLAVTGEEKGEVGSAYFAAHPTTKGRVVADLNMDMYLPLFPLKWLEVQGLGESTLGDDIRAVAAENDVKVQADKEPNHNRFIRSDQYSFIKKGVPSLAFKFGYQPGDPEEKIFKNWYTTRYHGVKDDLSQPKDAAAAAQFDNILQSLALRVADAAEAPRWKENSFFKRFEKASE